ncbi:transposase [Streptomyces sp. PCS3-D2]|uniref:transposase n=1 Tax=Streptomyces sp. PCS3-D2 TaxID=1460244 RepID=UPI00272CBD7C|nr:transposase [Streptomyces sp. PCS3-D2]WKV70061.1 transposase [Streptomyces sp. PCS3-D2]
MKTTTTSPAWAPPMPVPGWMRGPGGQPEACCHRAVLDAIRYLVDNGIKWRATPSDFPPWDRVYAFFRRWRDHMLVGEFHDRLRDRVRQKAGRDAEPTAGVIDSPSVKADAVVGADSRGFDGGKLINGRKRHVVVDTSAYCSSWSPQRTSEIAPPRRHSSLRWPAPTTSWNSSGPTAATPAASSSTT